jgi:hypothetical protein
LVYPPATHLFKESFVTENTLLVRLDRLALIDLGSVPRAKRAALASARPPRALRNHAVGGVLGIGLSGFAALAYAVFCAYAWMGSAPVFGTGLALFCGFFTVLTAYFVRTFRSERAALMERVPATQRLIDEAEAEQAIDEAAWALNLLATAWNEAAQLAQTHAVSDALARSIDAHRRDLAKRMDTFRSRLRSFALLTGPQPKALPPPADWGHVVPVSFASP